MLEPVCSPAAPLPMPPSTDVLADKNARELVEARAKQLQAYVSAALRLVQRLGAPPVTYGTSLPYPPDPHSLSAWPGALQLSTFRPCRHSVILL